MAIWNNPVHVVSPRRPISKSERAFEIAPFTAAFMFRAAQGKWQMTASPIKSRPAITAVPDPINTEAINLLDSWLLEDEGDQKAMWKKLTKALDENRSSNRKLFS